MDILSKKNLIAKLSTEGKSSQEISDHLNLIGLNLTSSGVRYHIDQMRKTGTLNAVPDNPDDDLPEPLKAIFAESPQQLFRIGVLDIETTGLYADFGYILCCVTKNLMDNDWDILRLDETKSYQELLKSNDPDAWDDIDKELCEQIQKEYVKYDMIVTYNGAWFDIPMINTRMVKHGLPLLPATKHIDLYKIARFRMKIRSKKLDALKEFLGVDKDVTGHNWKYWQMAAAGQKIGFDYVIEHCVRDVQRLASVAYKMRQFIDWIKKS